MYNYKEHRSFVFTEEGQVAFLAIRDNVKRLIKEAGCVTMEQAISIVDSGDSWDMLACVDRLVELREIKEICRQYKPIAQNRIFI